MTIDPKGISQGLPGWAQWATLLTTLVLFLIRVLEFTRQPRLYVRLTGDLFFRLTNKGESLFCQGVILARNGPTLITKIDFTLKRLNTDRNTSSKTFPLLVERYGEIVKGPGYTAENHFISSSPLFYVPMSIPQRSVYLCLQREYYQRQQQAYSAFEAALVELNGRYVPETGGSLSEDRKAAFLAELDALIREKFGEMDRLIQLEEGSYSLEIAVQYENPGRRLFRRLKQVKSRTGFTISNESLRVWKGQLAQSLQTVAKQRFTGEDQLITYPELAPTNFTFDEGTPL